LTDPQGEVLTTDAAWVGPKDASRLLLVISGTHGVEGLAGSGCQVAWLSLNDASELPSDTAVLFIHMINPWGCAWHRRQTENNVDLNRNFHDFETVLPSNANYEKVHSMILNGAQSTRAAIDPTINRFRSEEGDLALATALFAGQYDHSDGVGFGGTSPTWSNRTLQAIVRSFTSAVTHLTVVDLHTGLGPFGYGTLLSTAAPGSAALKRARDHFGIGVVSVKEGSMPYDLVGDILAWIDTAVQAEVTGIALEFGTFELAKLLELQVDDCRRVTFGESWQALSGEVRADLVEFFYPATPDWTQSTMLRALQVMHLALSGLEQRA
jgi:hypothetical protein